MTTGKERAETSTKRESRIVAARRATSGSQLTDSSDTNEPRHDGQHWYQSETNRDPLRPNPWVVRKQLRGDDGGRAKRYPSRDEDRAKDSPRRSESRIAAARRATSGTAIRLARRNAC